MPELIDRHALLKKVYEHTQERERMTDGEWCRKCIYEAPTIEAEPVRHGRWIPCSERLPEVYERVLTADKDGNVIENFRCNIKTGALEWSKGFWITHWMPLPEPPESEVQHD